MEETDKTYMWLMIIAFVALLISTGLALAEFSEYRDPMTVEKIFE